MCNFSHFLLHFAYLVIEKDPAVSLSKFHFFFFKNESKEKWDERYQKYLTDLTPFDSFSDVHLQFFHLDTPQTSYENGKFISESCKFQINHS